jgi:hypothetical protein
VSDIDAYFTQSIVGAPFSAALGGRASAAEARARGIEVPMDGTAARLHGIWHDDVLIGASAAGPLLRRLSSGPRRWLERHALLIALLSLAVLAACGWGALRPYLS